MALDRYGERGCAGEEVRGELSPRPLTAPPPPGSEITDPAAAVSVEPFASHADISFAAERNRPVIVAGAVNSPCRLCHVAGWAVSARSGLSFIVGDGTCTRVRFIFRPVGVSSHLCGLIGPSGIRRLSCVPAGPCRRPCRLPGRAWRRPVVCAFDPGEDRQVQVTPGQRLAGHRLAGACGQGRCSAAGRGGTQISRATTRGLASSQVVGAHLPDDGAERRAVLALCPCHPRRPLTSPGTNSGKAPGGAGASSAGVMAGWWDG